MQIKDGVKSFKYETTVDKVNLPSIYYLNNQANNLQYLDCKHAFNCVTLYFKKDPVKYILILAIHSFTLFDRSFIDLYVENIYKTDNLLIIYNYVVLSSVVCFLIFFVKKYIKKYKKILFSIIMLVLGTLLIYIPTVVESRFSTPIFPLLTIMSAMYFYSLYKEKRLSKIKIICCQLLIMFMFAIISYLISQTITIVPINFDIL
jgi:hypothetical protein